MGCKLGKLANCSKTVGSTVCGRSLGPPSAALHPRLALTSRQKYTMIAPWSGISMQPAGICMSLNLFSGWISPANRMYSTMSEDKEHRCYQIPKFNTLFTYRANPFDKQLPRVNEWMDWIFQFSLLSKCHYERRIREASIMTTSYMYPFCKDINRFERLVKWLSYLFVGDDHVEIGRTKEATQQITNQAINCIRRLEAIHVTGEEHNVSLLNIRQFIVCTYLVVEDILLDMKMEQRKRFLQAWRSYCLATSKENELIEIQLLDLDVIVKTRLESGAVRTIIALIEYSEKIHISDELWYDDRIQRLMDLCNYCVVLINDVYSFEKEFLDQDKDMTKMVWNIVGFHVLKYNCSIEEAFGRSLDVIREYQSEYKELADSLINDHSLGAECKKFVDCVTAVNAGNFAVSLRCNRYNDIYETQ
ncbi:uncharacterized protein LOC119083687 [Bradysia coprophila]|uniref:uncharacterized protein LOC119083687 n=1 Tax=Bradysia coprophila TaxID=38358 RepID=UPI00187DB6D3|nr:uncharacterized protein LOC119083687 [Bradysia coprophila]